MKSSFCIDLQRFMLIPTKFPLTQYSFVSNKYRKNIKKEIPQEGECIHGCATRSLRGLAFKCGCYLC